ncbi:hypothetical protein Caci_1427 [Catenulispora acidiphila DSM 44928]|uniref:Uncharacterized protein n=1 Tax=Catenulispora acidiphila (strain DSM 44928 / JCM 14897 / NBRC 102108 / NRRL B-24433 / ID139908) TaxID=479433 RepID=C7Q8T5_CATAD|nr:hypothetical protein [Catenulispora acidiphila]ACU70350.1 hypothetical protein Caci_1427 [Catenulispora acidiphila DSM 44928]
MVTEQDLQEALADAVDDPAAERFTLGLSERALAEAAAASRWRRSMPGRRRRRRWVPVVAIGSAFAVAAAVGAVALGGAVGSGGGSPSTLAAPEMLANPLGQAGLVEFAVECFGDHGPKLDMSYVWDPTTRQYHGVPGDVQTSYLPSPDGKQALVVRGTASYVESWAVAPWSDAAAGRLTPHPSTNGGGMHWTADGKEVVSDLAWNVDKESGGPTLASRTADFYDPATGRRLASVALPQTVLTRVASGQWSIQEFQGDHGSVLFPLLSGDGSRLEYLNAQGVTVRTLTLQEGLPGNVANVPNHNLTESAQLSPDGRYLAEYDGSVIAVFDLQADGKRIGWMDIKAHLFTGWIGAHQLVTGVDRSEPSTSGSRDDPAPQTGHSPVYSILTPDLKVVQQATFVLPGDPRGTCATWPMSWAPTGQFPGAFVP